MKNILTILFISLAINAFGQEHYIGVQGGLNFTNITAKETFEDSQIRTGFIGGFNYERELFNKYRIVIDALYSQQGFTDKIFITDDHGVFIDEDKINLNYDYLSFPIKIGYEIGNNIKIIPRIGIVPSFVIKAEANTPNLDGNGEIIGHETHDHKDNVSKFDFGGLLEVGMEGRLTENIFFSPMLSYKHSLTTFSNSDYFENYNMRHYGFSFSLGLKYRL